MQEMNVELLKVTGLPEGDYILKIDDSVIGEFAKREMEEGINLAACSNTPQMKQAAAVRSELDKLWDVEGRLRGMKFIEYLDVYKKYPEKNDLKATAVYLDSIFSTYPDPYYKRQLKKYLVNKAKEDSLIGRADRIRKSIYALARTGKHHYTLLLK